MSLVSIHLLEFDKQSYDSFYEVNDIQSTLNRLYYQINYATQSTFKEFGGPPKKHSSKNRFTGRPLQLKTIDLISRYRSILATTE